MKINMMIGGVETLFPETDVRYFKKENEVVIYFLKLKKEELIKIEKNIKDAKLIIEGNYIMLLLKDFQYACNLKKSPKLMELYLNGSGVGFAFENENGILLDIATPTFHNAV